MSRTSGWTRWHAYAAAALIALSAFVQFSVVQQTRQNGVIHGDAVKYVFYAYNLKYHHVFSKQQTFGPGHEDVTPQPDKLTLPGYPAFLSLFVDGTPDQALVRRATLAQAGLGVLTTVLAFLVALRLLPLGWAFATGLLVAIQPHLAVIDTYLTTESLFTPLMLAAILALLHAARPDARLRVYAIAGVLLGLASLVRPQLALLPPLALALAFAIRGLRPRLKGIVLGTLCFFAVVGPWYLRNATVERVDGDPDLLVASLYHGSFPGFMYKDDPRTFGYAYRFDPDAARNTRDLPSVLGYIGRQVAADPVRYLDWYLVGKPGYFLAWGLITGPSDLFLYDVAGSPYLDSPVFRALRNISFALHWPLMLLAVATMLVALWRPRLLTDDPGRRNTILMLSVAFLYLIVLHAIGAPYPRYSIPFRPLVFVLALVAVRAVAKRMVARHDRQTDKSRHPGDRL